MTRKLTITTTLLVWTIALWGQTPTPQDCLGAIPVCQTVIYEPVPGSGEGNYNNEINTTTTCVSGESNSIWYTFTANTNGNLNFVITPDDLNDDYDWILFDITNATCGDILTDPTLVVSCNAAGGAGCHGPTGATGASPYNDQGGGCGSAIPSQNAGFSAFNDVVPMMAGNTYVLMVANWTGSNNGYTLDFSASTGIGIFDSTPPTVASVTFPDECDENTIIVEFSEYIQCSTIDDLNFQLTGTGGPYTVTLSSNACDLGGNQDNFFTLTVNPFLDPMGTYTLNLLANGSTEVLDLCDNPAAATSFNFSTNISLANGPSIIPGVISVCAGQTVTISPFGNNGTPSPMFNFYGDAALNNLLFSGSSYSFTGSSSLFVYVTEFSGICESPVTNVTVNVLSEPSPPAASSPAPICAGNPAPTLTATGSGGTLLWYNSDPSMGNPSTLGVGPSFTPNINTSNVGSFNFWVIESAGSNCVSSPTMVTITILAAPAQPTGNTFYEICANDPVPAFSANGQGGTLNWYNSNPTSGNPAPIGMGSPFTPGVNNSISGSYVFWVTETLGTNCESTPLQVELEVNPTPVFIDVQLNCSADLLTYTADLSFSNTDNLTVNDGTVQNNGGGSFTVSGIDPANNLTVTAVNNANGCDITLTFTAPDCSCPDVQAPMSNGDVQICAGDPIPALSVSVGAGETANWYSAATGGTLLAQGTTSYTPPGPGTYYAEAIGGINACTSMSRTAVSLTINPLPTLNSSTADCALDLLSYVVTVSLTNAANISVNSGSVTNNGGGSFTITGIAVNTDLNITATNANGSCSDNFIVPAPDCSCPDVDAPLSNGDLEICTGDPFPALSVTVGAGETADWYSAASGGTLLAQGTLSFTPSGAGTYYVETRVIVNGCVSAVRTPVTLTINPLPALINSQTDCSPDLLSYNITLQVSNADNILASNGTVTNNGGGNFTISNIDINTDISVLAVNNTTGCVNSFDFNTPDCPCPFVNAPVSNGNLSICVGDPFPALTVNVGFGETVDWYSAAAGGTLLAQGTTSFTPNGAGTYYAQTRVTVNGCTSTRTAVSLVVNPLPNLLNSQTDCAADLMSYSISITVNNAVDLQSSSGNVTNNGGGNFTISGIDINTSISVLAINSATNCFTSFDFNAPDCNCPDINAPVSNGNVAICNGDPIPSLSVNVGAGLSVNWYSAFSGGTLLLSGSSSFTPSAAGTYYAQSVDTNTGCTSDSRTAVSLTINPLPGLTDVQASCAPDLLTYSVDITVTNADDVSSTEGTVTDNGGGSFTISGITSNNNITLQVNNTTTGCAESFDIDAPVCGCVNISAPVSGGDVSICDGDLIPALTVTVGAGETVDWYDAATGGTLLQANATSFSPTGAGTFFAEARETSTGCLSSTRTAVTLTINPVPAFINAQTSCAADLLTYEVTVTLTNTGNITVSEGFVTDNGGGSFTITGIDIANDLIISANNPSATCAGDFTIQAPNCNCPNLNTPVSDGDMAICAGETIPSLSVTVGAGETVDWYDAATDGTLLLSDALSFTPAGAGTYYAETREMATGCLSATRTAVTLTINPVPALTDMQTSCAPDLLSYEVTIVLTSTGNITVSEGTVTDNGGGSFTITGIDTNNDLSITANNANGTCSDDFTITAPNCLCPVINAPVSGGDVVICDGEAIAPLSVTVDPGITVDWYNAATGGILLLANSVSISTTANGTYYAQAREISSGCLSAVRTPVILTVNPLPAILSSQANCAFDLLTYSVTISLSNSDNIITSEGTVVDNGGGSFTISGIDPANDLMITANNSVTSCSDDFIITAPDCSCPVVDAPVSNGDIAICSGETLPALTVSVEAGETVDWYDAAVGGTLLLADSPSYTPPGAGTYFAETREISSGCLSSVRTAVLLTINPLPTLVSSQADCALDLQSYVVTVSFTDADNITVSEGIITDNGGGSFTISGITPANDLMITASNLATTCSDDFTITAPDCSCPMVAEPVSDGDATICADEVIPALSVTVGAGETVDWYDAATGGTLLLADSPTYTPGTAGTYYAETRMVINGCTSTTRTAVTLTINPLPALTASQPDCALDLQTYSVTVTFSDTDNITASEGNVVDNGGGSFTISGINTQNNLMLTAGNSITSCTADFTIIAPDCSCPSVDAPVSGGDGAICEGGIIPALTVTIAAGQTVDWYDSAAGGVLLLADSPAFTPTAAGTYFAATRDLVNGCLSDTRTGVTFTINELPTLSVTDAVNPGCGLDNGAITLQGLGGQAPYQYQIDAQGFVANATFGNLAATSYSFDVQDDNGCLGTVDTSLMDPVGVTAMANVTDTLTCATSFVIIDGNQTTSDGPVTYEWTFGGNVISTTITAQISEPGMYILQAFQDACSSADTIMVAQNLSPGLQAVLQTENQLDCNITSATLDGADSSTGAEISYQWFWNGTAINGANGNTYEATTEGTYILNVTDDHTGCVVADTLTLLNNESYPVANAGIDGTLTCAVNSILADGSNSQAGTAIVYQWLNAGGNPIAGATQNTLTVSVAGTYTLMVQDTINGCANTDAMTVTADFTPPVANAGQQMQLDCNEVTLSLNGQGSSAGGQYSYTWSTDMPGTGMILSGANTMSPLIGGPGNYYLLVTNNDNGCTASDATFVTQVNTIPTDFVVLSEDAGCYGETNGFITITAQDPGLQILYALNQQPFSSNAQYTSLSAGSYDITAEDANGCQWDTTVIIQEGIELQLDLGEDLFIQLGDSVHLQPLINFPEDSIATLNWSNRDLLWCPDCFDPLTLPLLNTSTFQLDIVDTNGCATSDDVTIFVDKTRRVFIPNVFSPNADGLNDLLVIHSGKDVVKVKSFIILNRWGEMVFEQFNFNTNDDSYGWNGKFRGQYLNAGVFVYVAEIEFKDGKVEIYSGDVMLMR